MENQGLYNFFNFLCVYSPGPILLDLGCDLMANDGIQSPWGATGDKIGQWILWELLLLCKRVYSVARTQILIVGMAEICSL